MTSSDVRPLWWLWWILVAAFIGVAILIDRKLLPHDHWSHHLLYLGAVVLAQLCTTLILRRLGLSQEAHHREAWPNQNHGEFTSPNVAYELRYPQWQLWVFVPLCVFLVVVLSCIYLFVPPSEQIGRELALPLIGLFSLAGVFLWYCYSRPIIRVDSHGISGAFSRFIAWDEITGCRSQQWHDPQGDVTRHRIEVLGRMGKLLTVYEIADTPAEERIRFCEALRHVLMVD